MEFLERVSHGQYPDSAQRKLDEYRNWPELIEHAQAVVNELGDQLFSGPATCALIMDFTMKRLKKTNCVYAPPPWIPVMRTLRAMAQISVPENGGPKHGAGKE